METSQRDTRSTIDVRSWLVSASVTSSASPIEKTCSPLPITQLHATQPGRAAHVVGDPSMRFNKDVDLVGSAVYVVAGSTSTGSLLPAGSRTPAHTAGDALERDVTRAQVQLDVSAIRASLKGYQTPLVDFPEEEVVA